jgi:ectonucleotide pyrophosphatase/phosphodiesterase family member 5
VTPSRLDDDTGTSSCRRCPFIVGSAAVGILRLRQGQPGVAAKSFSTLLEVIVMHPFDRRSFLKGAAVVTGGLVTGLAPGGVWARPAHAADDHVAVYLVVVDGLRADQLQFMPQLQELAEQGTFYPQARAHMVAETGPNHTTMITGMRADRNGHPGNSVPGLPERIGEDPRYLKADSLFTLLARQAPDARAASVNAKSYVFNTARHDRTASGDSDAGSVYDPPVTEPDDSARDAFTGPEGVRVSSDVDPDLLWWNLGDVDRAGHLDVSGSLFDGTGLDGTQPAFQGAALVQADQMIRAMVEQLKNDGRWGRTVFIVTADHSMDWSFADRFIDLEDDFEDDPLLAGEVLTAVNGGACLYALRSPDDPQAQERLVRMRAIALDTEGVDEALYIRPNPLDGDEEHWVGRVHPDWGLLGDYTGELIVTVEPGWRIGHGGMDSNPIPGNHGHPVTLPIPVIVSGGWDGVATQTVEPDAELGPADRAPGQAQNIDLAPTAAWLLGLNPPPGGFDGRVLEEAFTRRPGTRVEVANVHSLPEISRLGSDDPYETAAVLSREAWPDGLSGGGSFDGLPMVVGNELTDDVVMGEDADADPTVVVASGEVADEAVAAGPLAARLGGPLLLTRRDELPAATAEEVARLAPDRVLVVGGTGAISDDVLEQLTAAGAGEVERLAGDDPADTARLVALEIGVHEDNRQVLLTDGDPALALSASPVAAARRRPLLLCVDGALPAATRDALEELEIDRAIVVGGEQVLGAAAVSQLRDEGLLVERIDGGDAAETGRLLAERAVREGAPTDDIYLAPADRHPEALALGPALHQLRGCALLVTSRGWRGASMDPSRRWLTDRSDEFVRIRFVGGAEVLSDQVVDDVTRLITDRRTRGVAEDEPEPSGPPADRGGPDARRPRDDEPAGPGRAPGQRVGDAAATQAPVLPATGGGGLLGGAAAIAAATALRRRTRAAERGAAGPPMREVGGDEPVSGPGTAPGSR